MYTVCTLSVLLQSLLYIFTCCHRNWWRCCRHSCSSFLFFCILIKLGVEFACDLGKLWWNCYCYCLNWRLKLSAVSVIALSCRVLCSRCLCRNSCCVAVDFDVDVVVDVCCCSCCWCLWPTKRTHTEANGALIVLWPTISVKLIESAFASARQLSPLNGSIWLAAGLNREQAKRDRERERDTDKVSRLEANVVGSFFSNFAQWFCATTTTSASAASVGRKNRQIEHKTKGRERELEAQRAKRSN